MLTELLQRGYMSLEVGRVILPEKDEKVDFDLVVKVWWYTPVILGSGL